MKRIITTYLTLLCISQLLYSQLPSKDNSIYRSDDQKLYVNKQTGIYLWISTSPDPNSEKIRLASDSSVSYANPMYLDTEGYNTIRHKSAVNPTTHETVYPVQDVIYEVYADGLNPTSAADFNSGSVKKLEGKKYFGGDLRIVLHSADATSGVKSLQYKLNNTSFSEYKETLRSFTEGENILEFYAVDKVGNIEETKKEIFYIDNTPPKSEYIIEGNRSDKYVSNDAVIKLTAVDNISGVKAIFYKINNNSFVRYNAPIPVKVFTNDETSMSFYAEDNLGNKEEIKMIGGNQNAIHLEGSESKNLLFEFYIDKEAPTLTLETDIDQFQGKLNYVSTRTKFTATADDQKSGVDKIQFSINNPLVENLFKESFSLDKEGMQTIRVKAVDYVGNVTPLLVRNFILDAQAPSSKISIGNPKLLSRDTLFISAKTLISIVASDDQSGIKNIMWGTGSTEMTSYSKPFYISEAGSKTIEYLAIDNVNNKEIGKKQSVYIDNLPPEIIHHFSVESIGSKNVRDELYTIYPTNVMLYIAATDARSGGERIEYSINNGPILTENPIKSFIPGNYVVQINAFDVLGNKSSSEVKFAIEK